MKYLYQAILTILIIIMIAGCIDNSENENSNSHSSSFDLQIMYEGDGSVEYIPLDELFIENSTIENVHNNTFSIIVECSEDNISIEYDFYKINNKIKIDINNEDVNQRLKIGVIEMDKWYPVRFTFNINSDNPEINNLNFWGLSNKIETRIKYNSKIGLSFEFINDYNNSTWEYSNFADILIKLPHQQVFGIYLGIKDI